MIITLTGPNSYGLQQFLSEYISDFVTQHTNIGLDRFDGEELELDKLVSSVQSAPFLAAKRLIVVRDLSSQKNLSEKIQTIIESVAEATDLIIVEPKLDKRSSYYKTLKSKTDFREYAELDGTGLTNWLVKESKNLNGNISAADANYLISRVGPNQHLLANELRKLLDYDSQITRNSIDNLSEKTPQSSVFELLDAAFNGDKKRALKLYSEQRQLKAEPLAILGMISWQLHILALIKTAGKRTPNEIASQAKLNPFVVQKSISIARELSIEQLKQLIADALVLDARLKSQSIDADEALNFFLLAIASGEKATL